VRADPRRPDGRRERWVWLGPIACAMVVVGILAFYVTTQLSLDLHTDDDGWGFGFVLGSGLSVPLGAGLVAWFVAGAAVGIAGAVGAPRWRWVAWIGAAVGALAAVLLGVFLAAGIAQGAAG
jgi:hypothetical protein